MASSAMYRSIIEDWSFPPNAFLRGLFLWMFPKHNVNDFHLVVYFFTIARSRYNFILGTSIKCFFHSTIRMISRKELSMSCIHSFLTVLQLNITRVFFTNATCKMTFNTITAQVSICWKIIYGAKQHCMQTKQSLRIWIVPHQTNLTK